MWNIINVNARDYLVNFEFGEEHFSLRVLISNFENFWSAEFDEKQLVDTFKKFNPLIELDKVTLMKEIKTLFTGIKNGVSCDIKLVDTTLKLNLKSTLGCMPFKFEVDFRVINNKIFFQGIVLPLLILVKGMQKQNEYLCNVIKKKDMEITEYKLDGAVLSRKTVETPLFDEISSSHTFDENLNTISRKNLDGLLDETVTMQLDKIKELICEEPVELTNVKNISSETKKLIVPVHDESPKKNPIETVSTIERKIKNIPKLEKPIIKKKPKIIKRLHNL